MSPTVTVCGIGHNDSLRPSRGAGDRDAWIGERKSYAAWVDCAAFAKGMLAPTKAGRAPDPRDSEDPDAYLPAGHSLDIGDDCGTP
jgi:hypothetical protein